MFPKPATRQRTLVISFPRDQFGKAHQELRKLLRSECEEGALSTGARYKVVCENISALAYLVVGREELPLGAVDITWKE